MDLDINKIPQNEELRLASFGYILFKENYEDNYKKLNFSTDKLKSAVKYINYFNTNLNALNTIESKQMINDLSKERLIDFLKTYEILNDHLNDSIYNQLIEIKMSNAPLNLKDLNLTGDDLIQLGFNEGEKIGKILNDVLEKVLEEKLNNEKENLINYVKKEKI